jgi:iron(II)-dependent oxidoreductase
VIAGDDSAEMVLVPAGEFWMGSEEGDDDEKPRHRVYMDAYYIDKYEVTNALYKRFMDATGRSAPLYWNDSKFNGARQPVVGVSWDDADAYCKWAGKRLPTEAEWEKAARGTDGRKYPWGAQWDSSRANSDESKLGRAKEVGSYPTGVSPYGVHDLAGNVWEWVADWYDRNYYERSPERNPTGPPAGQNKVLRGGAWLDSPFYLRSAYRVGSSHPHHDYIGFRCARGGQ